MQISDPHVCRPVLGSAIETERVAREWDAIAAIRHEQISSHVDASYWHVLLPCLKKLLQDADQDSLIDVGCGLGFVTSEFSPHFEHVMGVDVSSACIKLAQRGFPHLENVFFANCEIENLIPQYSETFGAAVANMTLMTAPKLDSLVSSVRRLLRKGALFGFTITHPCFWPRYWGYDKAPWFNYAEEIAIEAIFRISLDGNCRLMTTHIHRPLSNYLDCFLRNGFGVEAIIEPTPDSEVDKVYLSNWHFPRFLAGLLVAE
jgi:SAM-dependent methyltransferase